MSNDGKLLKVALKQTRGKNTFGTYFHMNKQAYILQKSSSVLRHKTGEDIVFELEFLIINSILHFRWSLEDCHNVST